MFVDKVKIFIKAGAGGNGCTSFYTEKFVPNGGPDGGNGGKGGDIVFEASPEKSSLLDFRFNSHFRAQSGDRGTGKFSHGKGAPSMVIKVPRGTVIKDYESGMIIADLFHDGDKVTVLTGGLGGKGNACFKSSRRQAPHFSQCGQTTEEKTVVLELMTIADVGLIGFPNVGKSTLLSVISAARPKIANYHFTTLSPNLGAVKFHGQSFVVADIPGLVEGASEGVGLGHDFLRHIDRTRMLIHLVDISGSEGRDPVADYKKIRGELENYNDTLKDLPEIIVLNKADLLTGPESIEKFKKKIKGNIMVMSGITRQGVDELLERIVTELYKLPPVKPLEFEPFEYTRADVSEFFIMRDDDGAFEVAGGMMEELARNVVLDNIDSFNYFQKKLKDDGVIKALVKAGAKDGDLIRIMDLEFDFVE